MCPQFTEPLHQLRISQAERAGTMYYEYELEAPELGLLDLFESRPITGDPQKYVSSLHERIEDRWLSAKGDVEEFTQELSEFGGELLDELIPDKLQEILWVNRRRLTSIQVLATEPFIPWELVHLRQPGRPLPRETRFLGQMGLVRWLYDSRWPPERLQVRPNRARYVIPDYPDRRYELPEAEAERQFLEEAFGATAVEPQPTPVRNLISAKGAFDLLHFAGHGAAETDAITEARLFLQGRIEDGQYIEAPFTTTTVNTRANLTGTDGSRPLVVLNACQAGRLGLCADRHRRVRAGLPQRRRRRLHRDAVVGRRRTGPGLHRDLLPPDARRRDGRRGHGGVTRARTRRRRRHVAGLCGLRASAR